MSSIGGQLHGTSLLDSNLKEKFRSQLLTPVEVITLFPPTQNHFEHNLPSTNQNKQTDMSAHSEDGELPDSEGELSPSDDESSSAQTQNQPKETQSYTLFNTSSRLQVCSRIPREYNKIYQRGLRNFYRGAPFLDRGSARVISNIFLAFPNCRQPK